jgi:hypothetical protein
MSYRPLTALYKFEGYKGAEYYLQVKPVGPIGRFFIRHEQEGNILLSDREAEQLMKALMQYFNRKIADQDSGAEKT